MWSHRRLTGSLAVKGRPPCRLAKAAVVTAGLVATVFAMSVAHADEQTDARFLMAMHGAFTDITDDAALSLGHTICDGMDQGLTYNQAGQILQVADPNMGPEGARTFTSLTISTLCPAHLGDIPTSAPPEASPTAPPAASATAPPPASATAPPPASAADADYLNALHQHGVTETGGDEGMIRAAHQICNDLTNGKTIQEVTASSIEANPALRPEQISYAIVAARQYYCPGYM